MQQNIINLNTGEVIIQNIKMTKNSKIEDFYDCDKKIVEIKKRGDNKGRIKFVNTIESNGIFAYVHFSIDENFNFRRIIIAPTLKGNPNNLSVIEASKLWFRGVAIGEYEDKKDSISGTYSWGHFSARYYDDRDYGITGGDIRIVFE